MKLARPFSATLNARNWYSALAATGLATLVACGGGASTGSGAPPTLVGTAAAGAPLAGAVVLLKDANNKTQTVTAGTDGSYQFADVSGLTAPLMLQAKGNLGGRDYVIHSMTQTLPGAGVQGVLNVTPATNSVVAQAAGRDPKDIFEAADAGTEMKKVSPENLSVATRKLGNKLRDMFKALKKDNADVFTTPFVADNTGIDKLYDSVSFTTVADAAGGQTMRLTTKSTGVAEEVKTADAEADITSMVAPPAAELALNTASIKDFVAALSAQAATLSGVQSAAMADLFDAGYLENGYTKATQLSDFASNTNSIVGYSFPDFVLQGCDGASKVCQIDMTVKNPNGLRQTFPFAVVQGSDGKWRGWGNRSPFNFEVNPLVWANYAVSNGMAQPTGALKVGWLFWFTGKVGGDTATNPRTYKSARLQTSNDGGTTWSSATQFAEKTNCMNYDGLLLDDPANTSNAYLCQNFVSQDDATATANNAARLAGLRKFKITAYPNADYSGIPAVFEQRDRVEDYTAATAQASLTSTQLGITASELGTGTVHFSGTPLSVNVSASSGSYGGNAQWQSSQLPALGGVISVTAAHAKCAADGTPVISCDSMFGSTSVIQSVRLDTRDTLGRAVWVSYNLQMPVAPSQMATISSLTSDSAADAGAVANGGSTVDTTPTLSGTLSAGLAANQVLKVYDLGSLLGTASVSGTTWSYTPATQAVTKHSYTAAVVEGNLRGGESAAFDISVVVTPTLNASPQSPSAYETVSLWLTDAYQTIKSVVWSFGSGVVDQVASVANGISATVGQAFDSIGLKTVTATYKDASGNSLGTGTTQFQVQQGVVSKTAVITGIKSDTDVVVVANSTVLAIKPVISGTLSAALANIEVLRVYDGSSLLGGASVTNTVWSYSAATPLSAGAHSFTAVVARADGLEGSPSAAFAFTIQAPPSQTVVISSASSDAVADVGAVANGGSTVDTTPTLSGTLSAALSSGQTLAVYDTNTLLGTASVSGTTWTYTPAAQALGNHSFSAVVEESGLKGIASAAYSLSVAAPVVASLLTDTGITAAQCYQAGSDVWISCTDPAAIALNASQDGMVGRDVTSPSNTDGKLGLSYSLLSNPAGGNFAVEECVKDNITGLTWEGKTATGTRAGSATFTNYDNTAQAQIWNGTTYVNPKQTDIDAATNAVGYKNAVNASALCGYTDWRLPTADELQSLVDYSVAYPGPTIDSTWFPNTPASSWYWSASPFAGNAAGAWVVDFHVGLVGGGNRDGGSQVRLVR